MYFLNKDLKIVDIVYWRKTKGGVTMKITLEMSVEAYPYAKQVYLNQLTRTDGAWKSKQLAWLLGPRKLLLPYLWP